MRFLIVFTAAVACAAAAPSHLVPFAPYAFQTVALPAAVPTISSGDIQAAAIDAQVKAADYAQDAIDKARLISDQAVENINTETITTVDQEKERLAEGFWSVEDKKWQALDALKTAEAQIDGAVASKADILAKSAVVAPYVGSYVASVAPFAPVLYNGYVNPALKSFSSQTIIQSHPEAPKAEAEGVKVEAAVKAAEAELKAAEPAAAPAEPAAAPAEQKAEAEKEKSYAAAELKSEADKAFAALQAPVVAPLTLARAYHYPSAFPYSGIAVGPVAGWAGAQPGFKYISTIQHGSPIATSSFLKTQW